MSFTKNFCRNTSLLLYIVFIVIHFISYLNELTFDFRNLYAGIYFLILCFINYILSRKKYIRCSIKRILYGYSAVFFIAMIHAQFVTYASYIYLEMFSYLFFILDLFLLLRIIIITDCFQEFITITVLTFNTFMLVLLIRYFDGIRISSLLVNAFSGINRYRNTYGLYHANQTGNLVLFCIIINYFYGFYFLKKKLLLRLTVVVVSLIESYMLLTTASRNAILSLAVFIFTFASLYSYNKLNKKSKIFIFIDVILIAACILLNIDMEYLIGLSLRGENFTGNLPNLRTLLDWLFGLGLVGSGYFKLGFSAYRTTFIDNYLLYVLMTSGITGCILIFAPFYNVIKSVFRGNFSNKSLKNFLCALSVMLLFSSMFETNLLYPQFISSFVYWLVIFIAHNY